MSSQLPTLLTSLFDQLSDPFECLIGNVRVFRSQMNGDGLVECTFKVSVEQMTQSQRAIYGYIFSMVFSRDAADEVLQETNVVICENIQDFAGRSEFLTWACRVAHNQVLAYRKRRQRDRLTTTVPAALEELSQHSLNECTAADVRLQMLRECKKELPVADRDLIESRYNPDGSVERIAEGLGRSPSSVSVSLHRIRRRLQKCIQSKVAQEGDS